MLLNLTPFLCQPFAYTRSSLGYLSFCALSHCGAQSVPGETGADARHGGTPPSPPCLLLARFLRYRRPGQLPALQGSLARELLFPRLG